MRHRAIIAGGGTGGHLYPALNLAEALREVTGKGMEILFIGAKRGIESQVFPEKGVEHELLPLEPIYRALPWRNWRLLPSSIQSSRAINRIFGHFGPELVVGTGGYAAGPVVGWAIARRLRTAIQEQNSYPGLTTRWLAPYVNQLHLGYREALEHLNPGSHTEVHVHGNPIRWSESRRDVQVARADLGLGSGRVVLIVGGSQGAAPINDVLLAALDAVGHDQLEPLPADVEMLWSTGPMHYEMVAERLEALTGATSVRAVPYISEMEKALCVTTVAVSRAGALALAELCAWGVPSILVPFPHAAAGHQLRNARALESAGAAIVLEEDRASSDPATLWHNLLDLLGDGARLERMREAARSRGRPDAALQIAEDLVRLMEAQ